MPIITYLLRLGTAIAYELQSMPNVLIVAAINELE
jgi:hypothetical protein